MRLIDADALEYHRKLECIGVVYEWDIDNAPTIDAEPVKRGEWIWDDDGGVYYCTICNSTASGNTTEVLTGQWKYCPNCGAKMDGGK